jgi:serine/threonine protein phosphatase PrpC
VKATPILGQPAVSETLKTDRPIATWAQNTAAVVEQPGARQDLSSLYAAHAQLQKGGFGALLNRLTPSALSKPVVVDKMSARSAALGVDQAAGSLRAIAGVYADHRVSEEELPALQQARGQLETILAMRPALKMLPPPVARRLTEHLFQPIEVLVDAAKKHEGMLKDALQTRDAAAIRQRLNTAVAYNALDVGGLTQHAQLRGTARYLIGDLIRVPLESGGATLGVVTHKLGADLVVEYLDANGAVQVGSMTAQKAGKENPLKIGDYFELHGHRFWVTGLDQAGALRVINEHSVAYNANFLAAALLPLERLANAGTHDGLFAGNLSTNTAGFASGRAGAAAYHTNKGEGYKEWDEDAIAAFVDGHGRLYVGVFDQAGGEGSDPNQHGAASAICARAFFEEAKRVATTNGSLADGEAAFRRAIDAANQQVFARQKGEASTFIGAMIDGEDATILNLGDSGAMRFSANGAFQEKTRDQGLGNAIWGAVGMRKSVPPDPYHWKVQRGDYLVLGSDGLTDSGLTEQEIGQIVASAQTAQQATRALRDRVLERMKLKEGKPDNLSIIVVRVGEHE